MITLFKGLGLSTAFLFSGISGIAYSADYPANIDYGDKGRFIAKRGTEYGRTAILMPVGPLLINLPEGPGSTNVGLDDGVLNRTRDSAWDLSDLENPTLFRQLSCDRFEESDPQCYPGMPILAHATVVRYDSERGPVLYARNSGHLSYHADQRGTDAELSDAYMSSEWNYDPIGYLHMTAPYYTRSYWDYGANNEGQFIIRDTSQLIEGGPVSPYTVEGIPELEELFGPTQLGIWFGEPLVWWDHLNLTNVTGFSSWHGNFLVVASDQRSTGLAIYDVSGFKEGRQPRLISTYNEMRTEPNGNTVGVGGYWSEPYGASKIVFAARQISSPMRNYPAFYIVDFEDPANPYVSCELYFDQDSEDDSDGDGSSDPMYVNFQDHYAYVDHFQVDMNACEQAFDDEQISDAEFDRIVYKFDDIANHCDSSQYFRPIGQVGIFGGYDWWVTPPETGINEQGMCFFVTDDEADTTRPYIAGHRPLDGQSNVPIDTLIHIHIPETLRTESLINAITVTNTDTNETVAFRQQLAHTGTIGVWPNEYLEANANYRVDISGIQDFMGNSMLADSFSFSTNDGDLIGGDTPELPEEEAIPSYEGPSYFPNKSSQLACQPEVENADLWVVNPDNDSVSIFSKELDAESLITSHQFEKEIKLDYEAPTSVSKIDNLFAVTYRDDDKVVFFNAQGFPEFSIDTGHGSQPISSVADGNKLYVSLYGSGELVRINADEKRIETRLEIGPHPKAMALAGQRLLITRFISAKTHAEVYDVDISQETLSSSIITINKVLIADDIVNGSGVPNYLASIVINDDATRAYVTAKKDNTNRGTRPSAGENAEPLDDDNTVRPMIATIDLVNSRDLNTNPETAEGSQDLDNGADPHGISFLPKADVRIHTMQGNNILVLEDSDLNRRTLISTGAAPQEICSTLRTTYVKNFAERSISAIDTAAYLHDARIQLRTETLISVENETLSPSELRGLQHFYESSIPEMGPEGYMSCASCHFGGGHDGRTWDLTSMGEGLRNTISLNGASGTRFGNLHWSANFDEVQDFEIQMEQLNGGEGLVVGAATFNGESPLELHTTGLSDELDALSDYVSGLGKDSVKRSPYRDYNGELSAAAQRGKIVFDNDNCASCHQGLSYRDGLRHDVGTITSESGQRLASGAIDAIRTPTLIELWDSAPYFHDGSATMLIDVFSRGDHSRDLSESELDDLVAYLYSIDRELYIEDE
ncbi:Ig-like domain-containing protein [Agaribacterium sp. ZY112]|uniref:Ig-like domain-containing protein n=1 Tax=Agaribacterium sp. ZY112 TaxID=3233574 RepID=UPI0035252D95